MSANEPEPQPTWLELSVAADAESVESVAELFARYGYNEGVVIEEPYRQDDDGDNLEVDPTRPVIVRTYLPVDDSLPSRRRQVEEALWHLRQLGAVGELEASERAEEDWANAWKEHFPVLRIGRHFVVRPSWREYEPATDDLVIHLDPGMAFGTGLHPSTELCLLFVEELDLRGISILDVGAGSGILTFAALRAGASSAVAVEIDPVAARALEHNIALNEMHDRVTVMVGNAADVLHNGQTYPVIFANIIARILADMAPIIASHLAPHGVLIASGIIEDREQLVCDAFAEHGLRPVARKQGGDWVALRFERVQLA